MASARFLAVKCRAARLADIIGAEFAGGFGIAFGFPGDPDRGAEDQDGVRGGVLVAVSFAGRGAGQLAEDDEGGLVGLGGLSSRAARARRVSGSNTAGLASRAALASTPVIARSSRGVELGLFGRRTAVGRSRDPTRSSEKTALGAFWHTETDTEAGDTA